MRVRRGAEPLRLQGEEAPEGQDPLARCGALVEVEAVERERSDAYFEGGHWLQLWSFLWGLGVAWLLLSRRVSARLRDLAERRTRSPALRTLPRTLYADFFREHQ